MKLKILLLSSIICFSCTTKKGDTTSISPTTIDSTTIWIQKAENSKTLSTSGRIDFLNKASALINTLPNTSKKTAHLSRLALVYNRLGDSISFRQKNKELIHLSKKIRDYKSHGEGHWDLGVYFRYKQPDSAIYHYKEAYTIFLKTDLDSSSKSYPGRMLYAMALVKENNRDYVGAEKDIVKAIRSFIDHGIKDRLFGAYNVLAITQKDLDRYDKALEYHKKAKEFIPYSRKNKQYSQQITNINNLASTNLRKGDYLAAITFYKELLNFNNLKNRHLELYAKAKSGLAYAKFKAGETNFKELSGEFLKSNNILDSLGDTYAKARNYEYYAELLHSEGETDLAIKNALVAKNIAEETFNNDRLLSSLKLLTTLDKENSAQYAADYFNLSEKLQQQERSIRDKFARIELETDEVIEENESLAQQRKTLIGISIGLLLLGLGIFIIIHQRTNNQRLKFQQSQQESNQEIYNLMLSQQGKFQEGKQLEQKRISEEIHDGILGQMLGIRLILSGLNERNDDSAITQRAELIEKLRELEEEIRTISHELNNAAYQKINNFIIALKDLVNTVGSSSKITIAFAFTESYDWDNLEGNIKINTYRITQECLQNCVKHAKCENITVNLSLIEDKMVLVVADDGVGFNAKRGRKGIGLKNIISRIEKINGNLKIDSSFGKGTKMIVTVPLSHTKSVKKQTILKEKETLEA